MNHLINESDYMSRHSDFKVSNSNFEETLAENYANFIIDRSIPKSMTLTKLLKSILQRMKC